MAKSCYMCSIIITQDLVSSHLFNQCALGTLLFITDQHVYRSYGLPCSCRRQTRSLNIAVASVIVIVTLEEDETDTYVLIRSGGQLLDQ